MITINRVEKISKGNIFEITSKKSLDKEGFKSSIHGFLSEEISDETPFTVSKFGKDTCGFFYISGKSETDKENKIRLKGAALFQVLKSNKVDTIDIKGRANSKFVNLFLEGLLLAAYEFNIHLSKPKSYDLVVNVAKSLISQKALDELENVIEAVYLCRDMVNEPLNFLNAEDLSAQLIELSKECNVDCEVFEMSKIESLKMGGLLAVNQGSQNPATFNILEWKPKNAKNKKPIVLVGKGVVYDTGGADIKTGGSMANMKCDMGGAATVIGATFAAALNKLPLHIVTLVPATENRINGHEYVAGDVITMYDGTTVEVLNTDAEGRMILADALAYAKKYKPQMVIDVATLTGAAMRAIGKEASALFGTSEKENAALKEAGFDVHERLVEFPLWEDYGEQLKSYIADLKNIGGPTSGAITAAKFLQHFTNYPWAHIDIAGSSFDRAGSGYTPAGGTGFGVRLLYQYLRASI